MREGEDDRNENVVGWIRSGELGSEARNDEGQIRLVLDWSD